MRKVAVLILALMLIAGCSKASTPKSPLTPETGTGTGAQPQIGPPIPTDLPITITPVDPSEYGMPLWYRPVGNQPDPYWGQTKIVDTCTPRGKGAPVQAKLLDLSWQPYPGLGDSFWAPAATLSVCNLGETINPFDLYVETLGASAFASQERIPIPRLEPGKGIPQFKVYLSAGVLSGVQRAMQAGKLPWPELSLKVSYSPSGSNPVQIAQGELAVPEGAQGKSTPNWFLPANPTLELLQETTWTSSHAVKSDRSISGNLDLFLYAPDLSFKIAPFGSCDNGQGITVASKQWTLWSSAAGGQPKREGNVGEFTFWSGAGWAVAERPQAGADFLLLQWPNNCRAPASKTILLYDVTASQVQALSVQTGRRTFPATVITPTILENGALRTYNIDTYGEAGTMDWATYPWDPKARTWLAPVDGPNGAAVTTEHVYAKQP